MKLLASTVAESTRVRDAQGRCQNFSKKMALGGQYRVFFPVVWNQDADGNVIGADVLAASVPGRRLDFDKLGNGFLRLDEFEQLPGGRIEDTTGIAPYARIARVFFNAEYATEIDRAKREADEVAKRTGRPVDANALNKKLEELKEEYEGDNEKNIFAKHKPMIEGVVVETATECLVVPLDSNGTPKWTDAEVAAYPLSKKKAKAITELVKNRDFCPEGTQFLETHVAWTGATPQEAGQTMTLQGISKDTSLATKFPALWAANAENQLDRISKSAEAMAGKNMSMSSKATPAIVIESMKKYMSKNPLILTNINMEDEVTKAAAPDMIEFGLVEDVPTVQQALIALLNQGSAEATAETADTAEQALNAMHLEKLQGANTVGAISDALGDEFDAIAGSDGVDGL